MSVARQAARKSLLDFRFLVGNVLANHRVVLAELQLFGLGALVLGGGVVVTCTGTGNQFDFVSI